MHIQSTLVSRKQRQQTATHAGAATRRPTTLFVASAPSAPRASSVHTQAGRHTPLRAATARMHTPAVPRAQPPILHPKVGLIWHPRLAGAAALLEGGHEHVGQAERLLGILQPHHARRDPVRSGEDVSDETALEREVVGRLLPVRVGVRVRAKGALG